LPDIHPPLSKFHLTAPTAFDDAHRLQYFVDGADRAVERATAAAVADLGKDQDLLAYHGDGVVGTHLGAASTLRAKIEVDLGDQLPHLEALVDVRL
jgi:hypothetical protein